MSRHLITSAIPYVNGVKHLGNLVGSMLPADVFARFQRQRGHETLFICGTDDHGTPVEIAAGKMNDGAGQPVAEFVAHWHDFQADIYARFGLSFDHFGSSSRPQNHTLTQHFARRLHQAGLLSVVSERMLYSKKDERFLPDRYVEGECPHCHYTKARGDQCENCGRVLDPTDLINPRSAISGSTELEVRETRHLHFKQSDPALLAKLTGWIESNTQWPTLSKSIALKWLQEGLQDRGITRDIKWGVPVPPELFGADARPDDAGKVFYVWFDAPIAYIAASKEWADANNQPDATWQRWWREDMGADDVTYTEFMGKDNVYFHTVSFPATLLGSNEPWKKVDSLKSFNWLTYYGGKFSTSQGIGIFTDTALELTKDIPNGADYWRYYLIARAPESDDSSFTWADLQAVVNKDLADVLGNFINRSLQLAGKYFADNTLPAAEPGADHPETAVLMQRLCASFTSYTSNMDACELRKAMADLREMFVIGNEYLARTEPWKLMKGTEAEQAQGRHVLTTAISLIPFYATVAAPVIPFSASRLMELLPTAGQVLPQPGRNGPAVAGGKGLPAALHTPWSWPKTAEGQLHIPSLAGQPYQLPASVIFPKITDEQVADWEARFGNQKA